MQALAAVFVGRTVGGAEKPNALGTMIGALLVSTLENGLTICAVDAINFDFGKSSIKRESYPYLQQVARILISTNSRVEVKGHTDNVGSDDYNMELSRKRAKAVRDHLIRQGVKKENLEYSYYGSTKPLTTNDTDEGRTLNRRVEFEIIK